MAVAVYGVATFFFARPAVLACTTKALGPMGDGTAGGVRLAWAFEQQGGLPFQATSLLTSAPGGEQFWRPEWWTQTLSFGLLWLFTNITNSVCSYNLVIMTGFMASALSMCALAYWLTRRRAIALLAGYAFAFTSFAQAKATGHMNYVHQEFFPLLLLLILMIAERPTRAKAAALGVVIAAASFFDGYFLLFSWLTFLTMAVVVVVRAWRGRYRTGSAALDDEPSLRRATALDTAKMLGLAAVVAIVLLLPLAVAFAGNSGAVGTAVDRSDAELDVFSADLLDYLTPGRSNPIFEPAFADWQDSRLGGSNYSEKTLFVGWSTMVLAGVAMVAVWRTNRRTQADISRNAPSRLGLAAPALVITAGVLAFVSGPRLWHIGGQQLPGASYFINLVAPFWRAYSRLFIPVSAALVAAASIGAACILARLRQPGARAGLLVILTSIAVVETMRDPGFEYGFFDYTAAPAGYTWIASQPDADLIADYPVWPPDLKPDDTFATFQPVHGASTVNSMDTQEPGSPVNDDVLGLADPQTIPILRWMNVDYVVVHPFMMPGAPPSVVPPALELVRRFTFNEQFSNPRRDQLYLAEWYEMDVFRIGPGPIASIAAIPVEGFHQPELDGWRTRRWTSASSSTIEVIALDASARDANLSFDLTSFATPRVVRVLQDGEELWSGTVGETPVAVAVEAEVGEVVVESSPGPVPIRDVLPTTNDPRSVGVSLSNLTVESDAA